MKIARPLALPRPTRKPWSVAPGAFLWIYKRFLRVQGVAFFGTRRVTFSPKSFSAQLLHKSHLGTPMVRSFSSMLHVHPFSLGEWMIWSGFLVYGLPFWIFFGQTQPAPVTPGAYCHKLPRHQGEGQFSGFSSVRLFKILDSGVLSLLFPIRLIYLYIICSIHT